MTTVANITTTVEVLDVGQSSISELATRISYRLQALEGHARKATEYAFEVGQLLIEAKKQVQHGEWANWLETDCNLAPRTARAYMQFARQFSALSDEKRQRVAELPIREALKAIITDPTPPVRYESTRRIRTEDERKKVKEVFVKARNQLTEAAREFEHGFPVKGNKVERLRKQLQAVLAQLDDLQNAQAPIEGGAE